MFKYDEKRYKTQSNLLKALSHPVRLWIVEALFKQTEQCVCVFVDAVGVNFSTVSRHLHVLKEAGIIDSEKRGKEVYYRLVLPCIAELISCAGDACEKTGNQQGDFS